MMKTMPIAIALTALISFVGMRTANAADRHCDCVFQPSYGWSEVGGYQSDWTFVTYETPVIRDVGPYKTIGQCREWCHDRIWAFARDEVCTTEGVTQVTVNWGAHLWYDCSSTSAYYPARCTIGHDDFISDLYGDAAVQCSML